MSFATACPTQAYAAPRRRPPRKCRLSAPARRRRCSHPHGDARADQRRRAPRLAAELKARHVRSRVAKGRVRPGPLSLWGLNTPLGLRHPLGTRHALGTRYSKQVLDAARVEHGPSRLAGGRAAGRLEADRERWTSLQCRTGRRRERDPGNARSPAQAPATGGPGPRATPTARASGRRARPSVATALTVRIAPAAIGRHEERPASRPGRPARTTIRSSGRSDAGASSVTPRANANANPASASPRQSDRLAHPRVDVVASRVRRRRAPGGANALPKRAGAGTIPGTASASERQPQFPFAHGGCDSSVAFARRRPSAAARAGTSVPSAYCAASASRRAERSGRDRFIGRNRPRSRHCFSRSRPRRTHDLTVPSGCRSCARQLGVREPLEERQGDRLLLPAFQRLHAIAYRLRVRSGDQQIDRGGAFGGQVDLRLLVVVAGQRHRVEIAPAQPVEAAVAHDAREPGLRLALGGGIASRVVPDADERLLQHLLGGGGFPQDTQRDRVQMRRRVPVELGKRPLVGKRGPREQVGERGVAVGRSEDATGQVAVTETVRRQAPDRRPFCHSTSLAPAARFNMRASTNSRSERRLR